MLCVTLSRHHHQVLIMYTDIFRKPVRKAAGDPKARTTMHTHPHTHSHTSIHTHTHPYTHTHLLARALTHSPPALTSGTRRRPTLPRPHDKVGVTADTRSIHPPGDGLHSSPQSVLRRPSLPRPRLREGAAKHHPPGVTAHPLGVYPHPLHRVC